jgi:predicted MFS family arabinose efflux permease
MHELTSIKSEDILVYDLGLSQKAISLVTALIFFLDILINFDHGALPSASVAIKNDVLLSNVEFGSLGSFVFLGLVIGSLGATFLLGMFKFRTLLALSFLGNGVGLVMFTMTEQFYVLCFARFISGFFQIILTIYIPLYADSFGTPKTKPFLLSMVLLAGPIGVVTGYGLTGIMVGYGITWRISFVI